AGHPFPVLIVWSGGARSRPGLRKRRVRQAAFSAQALVDGWDEEGSIAFDLVTQAEEIFGLPAEIESATKSLEKLGDDGLTGCAAHLGDERGERRKALARLVESPNQPEVSELDHPEPAVVGSSPVPLEEKRHGRWPRLELEGTARGRSSEVAREESFDVVRFWLSCMAGERGEFLGVRPGQQVESGGNVVSKLDGEGPVAAEVGDQSAKWCIGGLGSRSSTSKGAAILA
ncbi:MAG: hypothetical protein OEM62_12875, partial [Acidobacteriota bacterium]|nr:hypothetical protein [Acidobacteriota bacterium]